MTSQANAHRLAERLRPLRARCGSDPPATPARLAPGAVALERDGRCAGAFHAFNERLVRS